MTRSKVRIAVSWVFIILTVCLAQIAINSRSNDSTSTDSASRMQIQIYGKYLIGIRQFPGQNSVLKKSTSQLEQGILNNQGPYRQLASIPILAELSGREAALQELKSMKADPDGVADADNLPVFYQLYNEGSASLDSKQLLTIKGYGWVGRLALSQDKPDDDREHKAVLRSAFRMVLLFGVMTMAALAALLGGVILFIIAIIQGVRRRLSSHLIIPEKPEAALLETFAIYMVLSTVMPLLMMVIMPGSLSGTIIMSVLAGILPILWPLLCGAGWKDYRKVLGWYRGKGVFREVGAGITGYITGLPLLVVAVILVMILAKNTGETPSHPVVFDLSRRPFYLFLLACVYAPLVEETLFRGVLYVYLRRYLSWAVSAIVTGFIFALLHPQGWVAVPAIGVIGFNLSAIREWRGAAIASMTAHALNNGSLVLILIISMA